MVDKLRKVHFKYLDYLFEDMYPVKSKHYPDSTFFKKKDKVTLELEKSGTLWVLYSVWTSIADMFSLDYSETQQLIKAWMEKQIKMQEVEPIQNASFIRMEVEEQLKLEEVTPKWSRILEPNLIQEEIKSGEITPLQGCVSPFSMDGKELTPQQMNYVIIGGIEEELEPVEITPDIKGHSGSYWAESQLKLEEVTPKNAIAPPSSWRNLKLEEVKPKQAVFPIEYPKEITPEESIPLQSWRDLEKKEVTPRKTITPPFRWRGLDSVKYAEIKPKSTLTSHLLNAVEEQLKSEEITPRQVVNGSFDWVQEQLKSDEITPKCNYFDYGKFVEEKLKTEEVKPTPIKGFQYFMNEEELKSEDINPHLGHTYEMGKIDEEYEKK